MKNSVIIFSTAVLLFMLTAFTTADNTDSGETKITAIATDSTEVALAADAAESDVKLTPYKANVLATYYADKFNGRRTTSGERFHNSNYTAAHMRLPLGTVVRVTNEVNGKSVDVKVNDRGPYSKKLEIDLTKKAFMEIASKKGTGSFKVKLEIVQKK
nr:septal ring lytic transglycosylase RlpA family protein [uncultured Flavobacterium sp.]